MARAIIPDRYDVPRQVQPLAAAQRDAAGAVGPGSTLAPGDITGGGSVDVVDNGDGTLTIKSLSRAQLAFG